VSRVARPAISAARPLTDRAPPADPFPPPVPATASHRSTPVPALGLDRALPGRRTGSARCHKGVLVGRSTAIRDTPLIEIFPNSIASGVDLP